MNHHYCPACQSENTKAFYEVENAPVFSIVTLKTASEAHSVPLKNITLSFCHNCGFIYNADFDNTMDYFTGGYEDQQGYSATFRTYVSELSSHLIDKYQLTGKNVLEIGCGKGDFLAEICKQGNCKGTGIDPAYVPGRISEHANLEFIKDFYRKEHGRIPADMIICRHTLEHIPDVQNFMIHLRESLGTEKKDTVILFEIPDIFRILKIQAFWDIFYEHCSYFSPGSLARLFRSTGFEVLDIYRTYNEQYLVIEAKPAFNKNDKKIHHIEESVGQLEQLVNTFSKKINEQQQYWNEKLIKYKSENKKTVVWGGGSKSVGFLTSFNHIGLINHVVDINPNMTGNYIPGIGIQYVAPDFLKTYQPDAVIIMNDIYKKEITASIHEMDLNPEIFTL